MADHNKTDGATYADEVRDTIVKSGLTGVAATMLAAAALSPAGFGGMIGTSLASNANEAAGDAANDPYANLPAYPAPLTTQEVTDIRAQLAASAESLDITRRATEAKIEQIRAIAAGRGVPVPQIAARPARVDHAALAAEDQPAEPVVFAGGEVARDRHLELAALFLPPESR